MLDLVYRGLLGRTDILAALWIEDREIRVDESLDPEVNPEAEGRYYFSIGHEVGHWELHRHHILATSAEPHLLVQSSSPIVCRNSDLNGGRSRKERQNPYTASLRKPLQLTAK